MSPQHSNRQALIEGTLNCIEARPAASVTARDIAAASGANLASIGYHFDSKDALVALALEEGFKRWLIELATEMGDLTTLAPPQRLSRAIDALRTGVERHQGLVHAFVAALAGAAHDRQLRAVLARSYADARSAVADLLALGQDDAAIDAASLVLATFDGLVIQAIVDDSARLDVERGLERLESVLA
jgi:AcrR family transcriptional regulator